VGLRTRLVPAGASSEKDVRRTEIPRQGVGALLLLAGSALIFPASSIRGSSVGGTIGYLLLLVGLGFLIDRPWEDRPTP
jgi:hypothetical protein